MAGPVEEVTVSLTDGKLGFTGVSGSNPGRSVSFDYAPPAGAGQGYNGLELLLMSLAGCSATAFVYLLRKMGKDVAGLSVSAKGVKAGRPPLKFERISLLFTLKSRDAGGEDVKKALELAETAVCPVWQMLKNNVEVKADCEILPAG